MHRFYQKKAYLDSYQFSISSVPSPPNWMDSGCAPLVPPMVRTSIGRPKKERRRAGDELRKNNNRASKQGITVRCRKYFQPGHNARTCKNQIYPNSKYNTNQVNLLLSCHIHKQPPLEDQAKFQCRILDGRIQQGVIQQQQHE